MSYKSKVMAMAKGMKKGGVKKRLSADGEPTRGGISRPMRRADGGRISEDSKREAEKLREEARSDRRSAIMNGGIAAMVGSISKGSKIGKLLTGANVLAGLGSAASSVMNNREANRIERGEAEPGKEDRKRGGKVCK